MKTTLCDVDGCDERVEPKGEQISVCIGWMDSSTTYGTFLSIDVAKEAEKTEYKPFERPDIKKRDLCPVHLKIWCKASYEAHKEMTGKGKEVLIES